MLKTVANFENFQSIFQMLQWEVRWKVTWQHISVRKGSKYVHLVSSTPALNLLIGRYNIIALSGLLWFYDLNILHGEQQPCSCRHDQIGLRDYDIRMVWDGKLRIGSEPTPEQFWGWVLNPRMFWWSAIPLTLICRKYFFSFGVACFITRPVSNPYPWIRFTESLTIPTNIFCELAVW